MLQETIEREWPARDWQDYVVPQNWQAFTAEDHAVWDSCGCHIPESPTSRA
jgi:hypothetical protein